MDDIDRVLTATRLCDYTAVRTAHQTMFVPAGSPTEGVAVARALVAGVPDAVAVVGDASSESDLLASATLDALPPHSIATLPSVAAAVAMGLEPPESLLPVIGDGELRPAWYLLHRSGANLALESNLCWAYSLMSAPVANISGHLLQLRRILESIGEGRPGFHQLVGGFGTGKSTFAAALALSARANGILVLRGRCDDHGQNTAGALVEALTAFIDGISPSTLRKAVDGFVPTTSAVISDLPVRLGLRVAGVRATSVDRVIDAAVSTIVHLARDQAIMLILEDADASGPELSDVVNQVFSYPAANVTVVATMCNQRSLHQNSEVLSAVSTVVRMPRFDVDGVQQLWELIGPASALSSELSEELLSGTAGNPELLRSVIAWRSGSSNRSPVDNDGPDLTEIAESWCGRLTIRSRDLLHALAWADGPMSRNELAGTCKNEHPTTLHGAVRPLLDAGLVTVSDGWHQLAHSVLRSSLREVSDRSRTLRSPSSEECQTDAV